MAEKKTYQLYDGDVEISFYPNSHRYKIEKIKGKSEEEIKLLNKTKTSGTSAPSVIDKSQVLINWAVNSYTNKLTELMGDGVSFTKDDLLSMIEIAKKEWKTIKDTALNVGSITHKFAELYVIEYTGKQPDVSADGIKNIIPALQTEFGSDVFENEQVKNSVRAFLKWVKDVQPIFRQSEVLCYSLKNNHLGFYDVEFEITDGEHKGVWLGDFKTSSGIYPEMGLQVSSYVKAREEELEYIGQPQKFTGSMILAFAKEDKIDKDGNLVRQAGEFETKFISRQDLMSYYKIYKSCQDIYNFIKK